MTKSIQDDYTNPNIPFDEVYDRLMSFTRTYGKTPSEILATGA